jgi:serine/threonine-protein phosphatase 2A regulatory subunit A
LARSLSTLSLDQLKNTSALELFQLQLSSDSLEATMDAMHRLSIVAQSLKDPCRDVWSVVIPYVATTLFSNSSTNSSSSSPPADELLLILGQQLSEILSILPILDFPMVVETLLPLLERLASMEETVVREQVVRVVEQLCATQSHSKAAGKQPQPPPVEEATLRSLVNLLKRLASADWFTAKMSVCGMMPPILELVVLAANNASSSSSPSSSSSSSSSLQQELLTLYLEACQDETPMVRRAAAKDMGKLIQVAGWSSHCESFVSVIVPLLLHDEQDSVRRLAVAALADVGPTIGKEHVAWTMQHWLPLVKDGSTDMSW